MSDTASIHVDRWRRQKLLAIPILTLVLVVMLYRNFLGVNASPSVVESPRRALRAPLITPLEASERKPIKSEVKHWPKLKLDEIVARNPFRPRTARDAEATAISTQPNSPPSNGLHSAKSDESSNGNGQGVAVFDDKVQALYHDASGTAAIVDSHIVRPGDAMDGGMQVIDVTDEGITVGKQ